MKKMKTAIAATVALAACVGTQLLAQNIKCDTITMALTLQGQSSVSTSATVANAGSFSQGPLYYKTKASKFTQVDLLKAIAYVMHRHNPSYYTSKATLELVQGELGGFWNINDGLAQSYETVESDGFLSGEFNSCGDFDYNPTYQNLNATFFPDGTYTGDGDPYGFDFSFIYDFSSFIDNFVDLNSRTSISDGQNEYIRLDTGRHFLPVPWQSYANEVGVPYATTGEYPVGHMQPWGQIYVKDPGHVDSNGDPLCENVTFFFYLEVQECYDCFYLSSFISDATFKIVPGAAGGPPCCTAPNTLSGRGVDKYYLSLSFDNTPANGYLNDAIVTNDVGQFDHYYYEYVGFDGATAFFASGIGNGVDGLTPDVLPYSDPIRSRLGVNAPYVTRFTLNGIVTYSWTLTLVNKTDISSDYVGVAKYDANGYGFIGLFCDLITGTVTFTEKVMKDTDCCEDIPWYCDSIVNGIDNSQQFAGLDGSRATGWYGPGEGETHGYFNPRWHQYNPYPYFDIVGGETSFFLLGELPRQHESPFNPSPALTYHTVHTPYLDVFSEDDEDDYIEFGN